MAIPELVDRLSSMPQLEGVPVQELEWLATHGRLKVHEPGVFMAPGDALEHLFILLTGRVAVDVDRGVGPRRVFEWSPGDVTGLLPFSRMTEVRNDVLAEVPTEILSIHQSHFPEMVSRCPGFTAHTVHTMLDRARRLTSSDLQDEKMMSLGKLAAGLAHELNNPASAAMRGARLLRAGLSGAESASRALWRAGLSEALIASLEKLSAEWWEPAASTLSMDREGQIEDWLRRHGLDASYVEDLVDTSITIEGLDRLAHLVPAKALDAALRWVAAGSAIRLAAQDVEDATVRIYDLVAAVKAFTHMDKAAGLEAVVVADGLRDTMRIVEPRIRAKGVTIALEVEPEVPPARAVASDLNQVWMNLIENAIDAVGDSGRIEVAVRTELDRVVVCVSDDGHGIAPELISRIFDPFFTTKPPGQGVGLGLEIARQLLRRCGGEIAVSSEPGRTEFRVSLPTPPSGREVGTAPRGTPITAEQDM
ncbi:MAG: ATP-binding protein [Gemmatimonadota bacterium]